MSHVPSKDEILRLIRELAEELGGKSPGQERFHAATGISMSSILGKHFERWSDALAEAGLKPNQLVAKISDEQLLDAYIACMQHYGSVPSKNQLKYFSQGRADMPAANTFDKYPKLTLVNMTRNRLQFLGDKDQLVQICDQYISAKSSQSGNEPAVSISKSGWVYMFQHGARREYKIGMSVNPVKREGQIGIELPEAVKPIHTIETDDPAGVEAYWHRRFSDKRKNGEWFQLTSSDVAAFKRWKRIF